MSDTVFIKKETVQLPSSKRFFDISISLFILVLFSPVLILILLAIFLEMIFLPSARGSILYSETRISQGVPFTIYKFRIFKRSALEKAKNTNSVIHTKTLEDTKGTMTLVGSLLKQIYFDELPQLFNVLKGDMSLVGPRPTNIENSEKLLKENHIAKFILKAGITGYFQSHKGISIKKNQDELDMEYANFIKKSPGWKIVLYDTKILLISILTILRAEGI